MDGGTPKTGYRNAYAPGGRSTISRPVSLDMNSDDEIIVSMKRKRISDKKIAEYLRESGRVNYNPKTIGECHLSAILLRTNVCTRHPLHENSC